jgi:hypothetical protein
MNVTKEQYVKLLAESDDFLEHDGNLYRLFDAMEFVIQPITIMNPKLRVMRQSAFPFFKIVADCNPEYDLHVIWRRLKDRKVVSEQYKFWSGLRPNDAVCFSNFIGASQVDVEHKP